jgi:hypothetical protein
VERDYSAIVPAASAFLSYSGYLDEEETKARDSAHGSYKQAARVFAFRALKTLPDGPMLTMQVLAELDAMERQQGPCMGEFEALRVDLKDEIAKQARMGAAMRLVRRWILPVVGAIGVLIFVLIKGGKYFGLAFLLGQ